jgi:hypothetical protein
VHRSSILRCCQGSYQQLAAVASLQGYHCYYSAWDRLLLLLLLGLLLLGLLLLLLLPPLPCSAQVLAVCQVAVPCLSW